MNSLSPKEERGLLLRLRDGDEQVFEHLYLHYSRYIIRHLLTIVKSDDLVEDIVHDTFVRIWEKRADVDLDRSFKAYLLTIATHKAYDLLRRAKHDRLIREKIWSAMEVGSRQVEDYMLAKDNRDRLDQLLEKMPDKQRTVYRLAKLEGYSYEEIANLLHISTHTVNTHIKRANSFLKKEIVHNPDLFVLFFAAYCSLY